MRKRHIFGVLALLAALASAPGARAANDSWPKSLTLATASPGGVYIIYGEALAKILTDQLGIPVNPLPTQGPVHNIKLLDTGGAQLGFTTMGVALQGWNGTGDWAGGKHVRRADAIPAGRQLVEVAACGLERAWWHHRGRAGGTRLSWPGGRAGWG